MEAGNCHMQLGKECGEEASGMGTVTAAAPSSNSSLCSALPTEHEQIQQRALSGASAIGCFYQGETPFGCFNQGETQWAGVRWLVRRSNKTCCLKSSHLPNRCRDAGRVVLVGAAQRGRQQRPQRWQVLSAHHSPEHRGRGQKEGQGR